MSLATRLGATTPVTGERAAQTASRSLTSEVHQQLLETLGQQMYGDALDARTLEGAVFDAISTVMQMRDEPVTAVDRARIAQEVIDDILGHGPLEPLLRDPEITEIMVNRHDVVFVEKGGLLHKTDLSFTDEDHLRRAIDRIVAAVGRRVDEASPMVDARLPDGSRVNAVIPPIAIDGCSLTIRKFAVEPYVARDLIAMGTITPEATDLLHACVAGRMSILISGGTGSGKTTTLNVLSRFIPAGERIVTIEDAAELQLHQPHVLRLEARPPNMEGRGTVTIRDLVRNSLRMRPDRIVVGEVRDAAALDMLQAMNTGHDGSLTTVHANSARDALSRIETMVLMADLDLPVRVIREQIAGAIRILVHQERLRDGSRHVTSISEITGLDGDTIVTQDLFTFDYSTGTPNGHLGQLLPTGLRPTFARELSDRGVSLP
jgi:pilus assembly protein CpaF